MTATLDVLEDIARGTGPVEALLALGLRRLGGRASWRTRSGKNGWLTADAAPELVFATPMEGKW